MSEQRNGMSDKDALRKLKLKQAGINTALVREVERGAGESKGSIPPVGTEPNRSRELYQSAFQPAEPGVSVESNMPVEPRRPSFLERITGNRRAESKRDEDAALDAQLRVVSEGAGFPLSTSPRKK